VITPTCKEFQARLHQALAGADESEYRENVGLQCWTFMDHIWQRTINTGRARTKWNLFRYAGAVIPVVASGAGGGLLGHLHGTGAVVIGWLALVGGLTGGAINAMRPAVEYGVDLTKANEFEQLYWDVFNYAMIKLRIDDPYDIAIALKIFVQRMGEIAVTSGAATATRT
jgi:hypothetical protein